MLSDLIHKWLTDRFLLTTAIWRVRWSGIARTEIDEWNPLRVLVCYEDGYAWVTSIVLKHDLMDYGTIRTEHIKGLDYQSPKFLMIC